MAFLKLSGVIGAFCLMSTSLFACGDLLIQAADGAYINGRSLEFGLAFGSALKAYPRGEKRQSDGPDGSKGLSWVSKYGFIGVDGLGVDAPFDGINEKGLSFGELWFPTAAYQAVPASMKDKAISVDQLGAWLLGNFATVEEVKAALKDVVVFGKVIPELKMAPPLHFSIHDQSGKSIVVEFIDGKQVVYDNLVGVLTNFPDFNWQLNNLKNYTNLSSINAKPVEIGKEKITFQGQGSGLLGLPGDFTPPSRFVRLAYFKSFAKEAKNADEAINLMAHLFNTVDIPIGTIREEASKISDYTQWVIIKDITNLRFYYRTYGNLNARMVDLKAINFAPGSKYKEIAMDSPIKPQDVTKDMLP